MQLAGESGQCFQHLRHLLRQRGIHLPRVVLLLSFSEIGLKLKGSQKQAPGVSIPIERYIGQSLQVRNGCA